VALSATAHASATSAPWSSPPHAGCGASNRGWRHLVSAGTEREFPGAAPVHQPGRASASSRLARP